MTRRAHWIAVVAIAVSLAGCLSSAPATRLYLLAPVTEPEAAGRAAKPVTLSIREIRLPQYLDRPQIVTRDSGHRLQIAEFDQWGGNLREDMTRILAENLGRLLGSDRVFSAPHNVLLQPDYRVELEVLRFEREPGGQVRLAARWWLARGTDATLLLSREAAFSGTPHADSYDALVAAMSTVYGKLAGAIADSIRQAGGS